MSQLRVKTYLSAEMGMQILVDGTAMGLNDVMDHRLYEARKEPDGLLYLTII